MPARIIRVMAAGHPDDTFTFTNQGMINSLCIQADGKIVVGGTFVEVNKYWRRHIVRALRTQEKRHA